MKTGDVIKFDGKAGVDEFKVVSVADNTLAYEASGNGAQLSGSVTSPGTATVNKLVVKLVSLDGTRAVISVS